MSRSSSPAIISSPVPVSSSSRSACAAAPLRPPPWRDPPRAPDERDPPPLAPVDEPRAPPVFRLPLVLVERLLPPARVEPPRALLLRLPPVLFRLPPLLFRVPLLLFRLPVLLRLPALLRAPPVLRDPPPL